VPGGTEKPFLILIALRGLEKKNFISGISKYDAGLLLGPLDNDILSSSEQNRNSTVCNKFKIFLKKMSF